MIGDWLSGAPKRHRMIHFHGCGDVDINNPRQTQGVLGTSQRRMLGEEGSRRWEGISGRGGRRQGPLVGWLVGCFFGGGGDQVGDPVQVPAKLSLGPNSPQASRTGDK